MDNIENVMGYFGKTDIIMDKITAINRGCRIYDTLTTYMNQMPSEAPGMRMIFYEMAKNVLFALLISQDLMTEEELEQEFKCVQGNSLYDDVSWIYELADEFKNKYVEKRKSIEEIRIKIREAKTTK